MSAKTVNSEHSRHVDIDWVTYSQPWVLPLWIFFSYNIYTSFLFR